MLLTGVAGLISFGQAAFVGIGAYATAVLTTRYGALAVARAAARRSLLIGGGGAGPRR